jgi:acyl-CoA reductase-like NAD-dependent aldehyde dehydrogenase
LGAAVCRRCRATRLSGLPQVQQTVARARVAQKEWAKTSFSERRAVLRMILKFVLENQEEICKVSMLDSGKTRTCRVV